MANTIIQIKHSTVTGNVPDALANGELSINNRDGKLFYSNPEGVVTEFSGFPGPAGLNGEIQFNDNGVLGASANLSYNAEIKVLTSDAFNGVYYDSGVDVYEHSEKAYLHANAAFEQANTGAADDWARIQANAAYEQANSVDSKAFTTGGYANSAFSQANLAFNQANSAQGTATSSGSYANAAFVHANAAFNSSNTKFSSSGGTITGDVLLEGKLTANTVGGDEGGEILLGKAETNTTLSGAGVTIDVFRNRLRFFEQGGSARGVYIDISGAGAGVSTDLLNPSATPDSVARAQANAAFIQANSAFTHANASYDQANTATTNAATADGKAVTSGSYANSAFLHANASYIQANTPSHVANSAALYANGAFAAANTKLNLSGGTLTGDLSVQGNVTIGESSGDSVSFNALIDSSLVPYTSNLYNLGSSTKYWEDVYSKNIRGQDAYISTINVVSGTVTGNLTVNGQANIATRLSVGTGEYQVFPNLIGQFVGTSAEYIQVNMQNLDGDGSSDFVVTANNGTDLSYYSDLGKAGSTYSFYGEGALIKPNDTYLIGQGLDGTQPGSNVLIMATTAGHGDIVFAQGGAYEENEVARFVYDQGLVINQTTASLSNSSGALIVSGGVGVQGNLNADAVYTKEGNIQTFAQDVYNKANAAFDSSNTKFSSSGGTISGNVTIGTFVDFTTGLDDPTHKEGRVYYDSGSKSLAYYNDDSQSYIHAGQDLVTRVWNNSDVTLPRANCVFISGTSSANGFPSVKLASADTAANSEVIGLTTGNIAPGAYGFALFSGRIQGLNTSLITEGSELYLSDTEPGKFTTSIPNPPSIPLNVGYVTRSDLTDGTILVNIHLMEGQNKTTGAVLFAQNEAISEDPSNFFYDRANSRLGIGTSNPAANLHVAGDGLFTGNVTITGNLAISNAQSITTTELTVGGNTIVLNSEVTGSPTSNATIFVNRGSEPNVYIRWDETLNEWVMYEAGSYPEGHILHSEKTAHDWAMYTAMPAYEKLTHPIGADLANATNELAKTANSVAYIAESYALSSFATANSAYLHANAAFAAANSAGGSGEDDWARLQSNSAFNTANSAFIKANAAVFTVTANSSDRLTQNTTTGNIAIDLASSGVVAGTYSYPSLAIDAYGRVTSATTQTPVTDVAGVVGSVSNTAILTGLLTVDGSTSGLDADLLDGLEGSAYARSSAESYANSAFTHANAAFESSNTKISALVQDTDPQLNGTLKTVGQSIAYDSSGEQSLILSKYNGSLLTAANGVPVIIRSAPGDGAGDAFFGLKSWTFENDGGISFPDTTIQNTAWTGNISAANITSGVISTDRLAASGTANANTYLRGDGTWATIETGGGSGEDTWARIQANSAFVRANNSVNANTGGVITGSLAITGTLNVAAPTATSSANIGTNSRGNRTLSTLSPTGGQDGDIWYKYTP